MGQTSSNDLTMFGLEDPGTDQTKYTPGKLEIISNDLGADLKKSILCKCPVPTREICMQNSLCPAIQQPQISADNTAAALEEAQKLRDAKIANQQIANRRKMEEENKKRLDEEERREQEFKEIAAAQEQEKQKTEAARELMMEEDFGEEEEPDINILPDNDTARICQNQVNNLGSTVTKNQFLSMYGEDCGEFANQLDWSKMTLK